MSIDRRTAALAMTAGAFLATTPGTGLAQDWPSRNVRLVVPFPPGGAADFVGRVYAEFLTRELGQTVLVDNRGGAGGVLGSSHVAKSPADGYTLVLGSFSTHNTMKFLMKNPPYDPQQDFTPVSLVAMVPTMLVTTSKLPVRSVRDLISAAKQQPGKLNFGSVGNGTSMHLSGEVLRREAGIEIVHVPYKGQAQMVADLANGEIHMIFNNYTSTAALIQSGQVRALAVALEERWPSLPDVPTFAEVGLPDVRISSWTAILAPAGLPAEITARLERASIAFGKDESSRTRLIKAGNLPVGSDAETLRRHIAQQMGYWGPLIKSVGVEPQ
jgi:tripartite-type tricarboxylate transporter receptor subunit TctC